MTRTKFENPVRTLFASLLPEHIQTDLRFVWLSNFEAERFWASSGTIQLPKISQRDDTAIVNRLEEFSLFLAEYPDVLILREPSDPEFLNYLKGLGFRLPEILTVNPPDKESTISTSVLANAELCEHLSRLAKQENHYLLPFGKTRLEKEIISRTGLKAVGPSVEVCEHVNSKIYSRRISRELCLKTIEGYECESADELESAYSRLVANLPPGKKLVLKEAMGVSGKGLVLIDNAAKFQQIVALLKRRAKPGAQYSFVLEKWVDKVKDINYQIFISTDGEVQLLTIKEIITEAGVHLGHRFPPELLETQLDSYREAAQAIGKRLFEDGFTGVVGLDSIIDLDATVYPALEINARFNMSTYQLGLDRLIRPDSKVMARHYPLLLQERLSFTRLTECIGTDLFDPDKRGAGVLIQNFATVNANADCDSGDPFKGRLYVLIIGESFEQVEQMDQRLIARLSTL